MATAVEEAIYRLRVEEKGVDEAAASVDKLAVSEEKLSRAARSTEQSFARLQGQLDPAIKARQQYEQTLLRLAGHEQAGIGTERQRSEALALATRRYNEQVAAVARATAHVDKYANSSGLARHELINFSRQIQDVTVSLASGQSLFTVAIQQGTQLADIFASSQGTVRGFFGQVSAGLSAVITPLRAVSVGVAAGVATVLGLAHAYRETEREVQLALMGIGRASGVSARDIERFANSSKSSYGLTVSEARTAATEFAKTGRIYGESVGLAEESVANFARISGMDIPAATKFLAEAYTTGAAGADKLNSVLGHLSGRQREHIATLYATGRAEEARRATIQGVIDATQQAERALGPLDKALIQTRKLWDAMWEAAKRGANFVAGGGTGESDLDRLNRLRGGLSGTGKDREGEFGIGRQGADGGLFNFFSPVKSREQQEAVRKLSDEIKGLEASVHNAGKAAADARLKQLSADADAIVRSIIPQIDKIRDLSAQYEKLKEAKREAEASGQMGQAANLDAATSAVALLIRLQRESQEETARQVAAVHGLSSAYANIGQGALVSMQGLTVETQRTLALGNDQLAVANSRTGAERLITQEIATRNALMLQGKSLEEASLIAAQQRSIAQAQINASASEQLLALQDQVAVAGAYNEEERISAQYVADRNELLRQGVNPALAEQVAQMKAAVAEQALLAREAQEYERTLQRQQEIGHQRRLDQIAAQQAAMAAFIQRELEWIRMVNEAHFTYGGNPRFGTQFADSQGRPNRYESTLDALPTPLGLGFGDYSVGQNGIALNQQGLTNIVDSVFKRGGSVLDAINKVMGTRTMLDQTSVQFLQQLTELLPDAEKESAIQRQIEALGREPASLARTQLLKQLTDSLDQLRQSTDSLNSTMQIELDPIFSQGHDALKIGYYKAATGLEGIVQGNGGEDSVPVHMMLTPGERVTVDPPGMPRSSGRDRVSGGNTTVVLNNYFPSDAVGERRRSARQLAEGFGRAVRGGAR